MFLMQFSGPEYFPNIDSSFILQSHYDFIVGKCKSCLYINLFIYLYDLFIFEHHCYGEISFLIPPLFIKQK